MEEDNLQQVVPPENDPPTAIEQEAIEQAVEQEQAIEQGIEQGPALDIQTPAINDLMMALAYPDSTDSYFLTIGTDSASALAKTRPEGLPQKLPALLDVVDLPRFFVSLVNSGNMIEIAAWNQAIGDSFPKWSSVSQAVLSIIGNQTLHTTRCRIYQPYNYGGQGASTQDYINQVKESILQDPNVPSGVTIDELSWDAIQYKVPPTASEIFCYKNPSMVAKLTDEQRKMIDKVQDMVESTIKEKCAEFRSRMNTIQDEFLPDMTLYLEQQIAGFADAERAQRIEGLSRGVLISYVDKMQNLFCGGNLPAAVQPAKIYSCHDVITASELRASIMKLAESQVIQQSNILGNPYISNRASALAQQTELGSSNWTKQQQASILIKKNVDIFMRRAVATMGDRYDNPMHNLSSQLAGSSNTLAQQIQAQSQQPVVQQTEQQKEVSKQQLSVLMACLRMRANATQQSDWELLPDEDLDHLEIVKFLATQTVDNSAALTQLYTLSSTMISEYTNGHNLVKFQGKALPPELIEMVNYTVDGRARALIGAIPAFAADIQQNGMGLKVLMYCIVHALAQKQRIAMETRRRLEKRLLTIQV